MRTLFPPASKEREREEGVELETSMEKKTTMKEQKWSKIL